MHNSLEYVEPKQVSAKQKSREYLTLKFRLSSPPSKLNIFIFIGKYYTLILIKLKHQSNI